MIRSMEDLSTSEISISLMYISIATGSLWKVETSHFSQVMEQDLPSTAVESNSPSGVDLPRNIINHQQKITMLSMESFHLITTLRTRSDASLRSLDTTIPITHHLWYSKISLCRTLSMMKFKDGARVTNHLLSTPWLNTIEIKTSWMRP